MDVQKIHEIADRADFGMGAYIDADSFKNDANSTVCLDDWFSLRDLKDLIEALEP